MSLRVFVKKCIRCLLVPSVLADYFLYTKALTSPSRFALRLRDFYPQIKDKTIKTGFDRHYVYHTAWAARVISETMPVKHIDISSSLYFSAIASAFVPIDFYDYRPADIHLSGLQSKEGDLLALPFADNSVASLSCMHTIEHVGLGRYGEPIDPEGDIKACRELARVTTVGGTLLFVTPVGKEAKIEFNAHRIYTYEQVEALFPNFSIKEFSLIPEHWDGGGLIRNASRDLLKDESYACGCFWLVKN